MRPILSSRCVAVTGVVAVALAGTAMVNGSRPSGQQLSLQEAARRTIAAGSARLSGTVSAADGTAVTFEGLASFVTADAEVRARASGAGGDDRSFVEVRSNGAGTWLRTPALGRWIDVPMGGAGLPMGWREVLRQLSRSEGASDRTEFDVDDQGRIRWLRFADAGAGVEVAFRDFGVPVNVDPPAPLTP